MMVRWLMLVGCVGVVAGADLAQEVAVWGPVSTTSADIKEGQWFGQALGTVAMAHPLNGLFLVDRDTPVDVQVAGGYTYDRSGSRAWDAWYDWTRMYVRTGTDSLAEDEGSLFGTIGLAHCFHILVSVQGEIGAGEDRGFIANGELSLFILRVRGELDDHVRTIRIGSGPRILGTAGPLAFGVLVDWSSSRWQDDDVELSSEGAIASGYVVWRVWNHLLLCAEIQGATNVYDLDDLQDGKKDVLQATIGVGYTF